MKKPFAYGLFVTAGLISASLVTAQQKPGTLGARLVYGDAKNHTLNVLDLESGKALASFSTPGKITYVQASPSGQYAFAAHREDHRVTVLHSGLSAQDHGDHKDLIEKAPHVLSTMNIGRQPTHYFAHDKDIAFFNDQDGTVAIMNEDKLGLSLDYELLKTAQPDHGAPVVMNDVVLVGYLRLNRVDVYSRKDAKVLQTFPGCPVLHGEALRDNAVYFGCGDGVLILTRGANGQFTSQKLTNPSGTPENTRVGTVTAHDKQDFVFGNFGKGLAVIKPGATALEPLALPANPVKFEFTRDGASLVVLTADGNFHRLDPKTLKVQSTISATPPVPATAPGGEGAIRPSFAQTKTHAYITSPDKGEILEVDLNAFKLERKFSIGGTPSSVTALWLEGAIRH
jgi:hypothetical protein